MGSSAIVLPGEIIAAAGRGWRLLPVRERGKTPLVPAWPQRATSALEQLEAWALEYHVCNWGVATGPGTGIFVVDVDGMSGQIALAEFWKKGYVLPATLTVATGDGLHHYFRWPAGRNIRNSAGKLARGLDIRGDGGFVVIPPSIHPSGVSYAYVDPGKALAEAPAWLSEMAAGIGAQEPRTLAVAMSILCEGERNDGLTRLAGAMRRRGATLPELERGLLEANVRRCRPSLPDAEVRRIAASVATYPVGGPDPLDCAWAAVAQEAHSTGYERFVALARQLQLARPGLPIALPLQRIGLLMECDWTQVRRWRVRCMRAGLLHQVGKHIPHRKAALYNFDFMPH